jgi:hypothetical protein
VTASQRESRDWNHPRSLSWRGTLWHTSRLSFGGAIVRGARVWMLPQCFLEAMFPDDRHS